MPRIVVRTLKFPAEVQTDGKPIHVCRCGLSARQDGLCDGSHQATLSEDEKNTYCYDSDLNREEIREDEDCCCGENCQHHQEEKTLVADEA